MQAEEIKQEAQKIAESLGENDEGPVNQIGQIIEVCGLEFAQKMLDETEKIEEKGGIKTHNGKRRRTKGGVFFFIAKGRMEADKRKLVFPNFGKNTNNEDATPSGIEWAVRSTYLKPLLEEAGQVNNLNITLTGRPGKIHTEGSSVMTVIEQKEVKSPPYPKGVPSIESVDQTTTYYVLMSVKQWAKVEKALEDETDMMIIEGTAVYDSELEGICILTTGTSTKVLERQKRQQAAQEKKEKKEDKPAKSGKPDKSNNKKPQGKSAPKATQPAKPAKDLGDLPPSVSSKLQQLHSAAETLRQKIATLEEKGQKTGLNMTRRLLEQTEKQIATLEKQYEK